MPVTGLLSARCKLPSSRSTHANFCGAQATASFAPFSSRRAVYRLQGRRAQLRCAADSNSSEQQSKTVKDQLAAKQLEARKRKDRGDLFTDNWGGDVWKGSKINVLSIILAVSILVPLGGLLFAYLTFGTLWG
ncbi:hypothetical protein WJX79_005895 [Trebouxia sp. C0005]